LQILWTRVYWYCVCLFDFHRDQTRSFQCRIYPRCGDGCMLRGLGFLNDCCISNSCSLLKYGRLWIGRIVEWRKKHKVYYMVIAKIIISAIGWGREFAFLPPAEAAALFIDVIVPLDGNIFHER
jgi:hypothetical protein